MALVISLFAVDNRTNQLKNQFQDFSSIRGPHVLVEALVRDCGFEPIFDGSATTEQISKFLFESDFGVVLQQIILDFEGFPERLFEYCSSEDDKYHSHIESLRKNQYVSHLKCVFEFILGQIGKRKDLGQEIVQILSSLDQLVKFLTPVTHDME